MFSSDLSFNNLINCMCNESTKILEFINHNTVSFSNVHELNILYTSPIHSVLKYASIVR